MFYQYVPSNDNAAPACQW